MNINDYTIKVWESDIDPDATLIQIRHKVSSIGVTIVQKGPATITDIINCMMAHVQADERHKKEKND